MAGKSFMCSHVPSYNFVAFPARSSGSDEYCLLILTNAYLTLQPVTLQHHQSEIQAQFTSWVSATKCWQLSLNTRHVVLAAFHHVKSNATCDSASS